MFYEWEHLIIEIGIRRNNDHRNRAQKCLYGLLNFSTFWVPRVCEIELDLVNLRKETKFPWNTRCEKKKRWNRPTSRKYLMNFLSYFMSDISFGCSSKLEKKHRRLSILDLRILEVAWNTFDEKSDQIDKDEEELDKKRKNEDR